MSIHCWEDSGGSTCMLLDGHDGPHEFTFDDEIVVCFGQSESAVTSEPPTPTDAPIGPECGRD